MNEKPKTQKQLDEDPELRELRKQIQTLTKTLEQRKEKQTLETQLQELEAQLKQTQPQKNSTKILTGLKKDLGGLGKKLADWWTMEGLTEQQKQTKKNKFMKAQENFLGSETGPSENFPDFLGLFKENTPQNTKKTQKRGGKQTKNTVPADNDVEYVIKNGKAYPVHHKNKQKVKKTNTKKKKQSHTTHTEEEHQPFFDPFN